MVVQEKDFNIVSRWTYWWMNAVLKLGKLRPLEMDDLPQVPDEMNAQKVVLDISSEWAKELNAKGSNAKLWKAFLRSETGKLYIRAIFFKLPNDIIQFMGPVVLSLMVKWIKNRDEPLYYGLCYILLMFASNLIQTLYLQRYWVMTYAVSQNLKTALSALVFSKSLRISSQARKSMTQGEIINFMSVDASSFSEFFPFGHNVWSAPLQMLISLIYLFVVLGAIPTIVSVVLLATMVPLNKVLTSKMTKYQKLVMEQKDKRVRQMNEILQGVRVIKLYHWEEPFEKEVLACRQEESWKMMKSGIFSSLSFIIAEVLPTLVGIITFIIYVKINGTLTPEVAFSSQAVMNILRFPIAILPMVITNLVKAKVGYKRIADFLAKDDMSPDLCLIASRRLGLPNVHENQMFDNLLRTEQQLTPMMEDKVQQSMKEITKMRTDDVVLRFKGASFSWTGEVTKNVVHHITLDIKRGKLVSIIGPVASGKSTILQAIFGDCPMTGGERYLDHSKRIAYCSQEAWLRNATLRENITGQTAFNQSRYDQIIQSCCLGPDLDILPHGDETEIGEKGINLSGGQKQRISLARAVYMDADVYLLDSPLSAVDPHVASQLFYNCIRGTLKDKTVILVTHSLQFLPYSDVVVAMKDGKIDEVGTYEELVSSGLNFASLMSAHGGGDDKPVAPPKKLESEPTKSPVIKAPAKDATDKKPASDGKIIKEETRNTGSVGSRIFIKYLKMFGCDLPLLVFFILFSQVTLVGIQVTMGWYIDGSKSFVFFVVVGLLLWFSSGFISIMRAASYYKGALNAATSLHNAMLKSTLRAPLSWFDQNPVGRIINRFSQDQNAVDSQLPMSFNSLLNCAFRSASIVIVVISVMPQFLTVVPLIGYVYVKTQQFYRFSSREVKRLSAISKSPIFNHFTETVSGAGASTLRAHRMLDESVELNCEKLEYSNKANYMGNMLNRWLGLRLELIGTCIITATSCAAVVGRNFDWISPTFAGLALSYALNFTNTFGWMVRMVVEMESQLTSVERLEEYSNLPKEPEWLVEPRQSANWPPRGNIRILDICMRYRPELDLVLKKVCADIKGGEKVGVVGRTGSGKSSLVGCLFRLFELESGMIEIDGVNIGGIGITDLRSKLGIIPQDPVLFAGSVRRNLDPFNEHSDDELWSALAGARLDKSVKKMERGLDTELAEGGSNFSAGERQLLCVVRALVRNSRIVVLDEATANVDVETDALIQLTVREQFKNSTLITIAHRINTIIDYDKILVMDDGRVAEFDSPANLLRRPNSHFYSSVQQLGASTAELMMQIAFGQVDYRSMMKQKLDETQK